MSQEVYAPEKASKPRVLIADDHALMAEGMQRLLASLYDVAEIAVDGRSLVQKALTSTPDLVILDIAMPELNGLEAARQLIAATPAVKVVFVTQHLDAHYVQEAFQIGALGYVAKQSASVELLEAVQRALSGRLFVTPLIQGGNARNCDDSDRFHMRKASSLTTRQREVLQLVAEGKTGKEIAERLSITLKTVEFHKHALMGELGLRTTADLTRYALSAGIVFDAKRRL